LTASGGWLCQAGAGCGGGTEKVDSGEWGVAAALCRLVWQVCLDLLPCEVGWTSRNHGQDRRRKTISEVVPLIANVGRLVATSKAVAHSPVLPRSRPWVLVTMRHRMFHQPPCMNEQTSPNRSLATLNRLRGEFYAYILFRDQVSSPPRRDMVLVRPPPRLAGGFPTKNRQSRPIVARPPLARPPRLHPHQDDEKNGVPVVLKKRQSDQMRLSYYGG